MEQNKAEREKEGETSGGEGVRQSKVFQVFVPPQFTCLMKLSMSLIAGVMTSDWLGYGVLGQERL